VFIFVLLLIIESLIVGSFVCLTFTISYCVKFEDFAVVKIHYLMLYMIKFHILKKDALYWTKMKYYSQTHFFY